MINKTIRSVPLCSKKIATGKSAETLLAEVTKRCSKCDITLFKLLGFVRKQLLLRANQTNSARNQQVSLESETNKFIYSFEESIEKYAAII